LSTHQTIAAGSHVRVRDEDWLVIDVEETEHDGLALTCTGASALVQDERAVFFTELDEYTVLRPEHTRFTDDHSSHYTDARLADVVGLGKTLEIGLLLAELIRRGRGNRILVVVPQQILDQFQRELWTRSSIPLLRMDSDGIARVQQQLPAGRNPFEFHQRIIISVDTLKSERWERHLQKVSWDAVVFDESHNLIGGSGGRNLRRRLARLVATTTEALIFASATPHPGKDRDFAELIDMLDPTRIVDRDNYDPDDVADLIIRRTKVDPEVKQGLSRREGIQWAERAAARGIEVAATEAEEAVFAELEASWRRHSRTSGSSSTPAP
jgi:SNF2 family DNA or RNA helicase